MLSVNVRDGIVLLATAGACAPAIAGGIEASISLEPTTLLHDADAALDSAPIAPLDAHLVRLRLSHAGSADVAPPARSLSNGPIEIETSQTTLSLQSRGSVWEVSDAVYADDDALARSIEIEDASPLELGPKMRIHFQRPTSLRDGGIGGSQTSLNNAPTEDRIYGFENGQGQFDLYDISLRWNTLTTGPVSFALIGGVKAVSTDVTEGVAEFDAGGNHVSTRAEDEYRMVPVPIVGGSFRWDVGERFFLEGTAQTHTIPDGNTLLDLTAETGIDFSPTVGLRAGYTYVRTAVELEQFDARLTQSGVFARVQIRF